MELEATRRFLESTTDFAVIHCSLDGEIQAWSGAAERLLGFTPDEAVGMSLSAFFTEEDRQRGLDVHEIAVARSQGRSEDDRWHLRKDGSRFWASGVLGLVRADADGPPVGLCKVLRDKTDVRTQIEALENKVVALKASLTSEREGVSALAHELRNPLMPIMSALELLQRSPAQLVSDRALKILGNQVALLKRLLDDLGAIGTDAASNPRLSIRVVNLNALLTELIESLQEAARSSGRTLSLVLPPHDIRIAADPERLQQMLLNLLSNALKYTEDDGRVDVAASIEGSMAVIRVDDDGVGISARMLPHIFELFTREGRQPDIGGAGVGLAIVKELADAHGGSVEARSAGHNKGAKFSLRIPLHQAATG
jgi:PAS domain S-box-containing protein